MKNKKSLPKLARQIDGVLYHGTEEINVLGDKVDKDFER